jgi:serine/threonine protein kinase
VPPDPVHRPEQPGNSELEAVTTALGSTSPSKDVEDGSTSQQPQRSQIGQFGLRSGDLFADRYEIDRELGRGGFGVVYAAFDRGPLQRTVALKVIPLTSTAHPHKSTFAHRRFLEEARLAGSLSHSHIATIFDFGESAGCVYMTQELAAGRDLRKILADPGHLPLRRALAIGRQICDGLSHAHARGIVHRDMSPGNIVVDAEDQVKITDFGLASSPQVAEDSEAPIAGTPGYMAPEQLLTKIVDARSDIFAVGCILYQMLSGRLPFPGETVNSIVEKTLNVFPPGPSLIREDLPRPLDRIVERAMRKDPGERYSNLLLLAEDLLNYEQFEYVLDRKQAADEITTALEAQQCILFVGLHLPAIKGESKSPTSDDVIAKKLAEQLGGPPRDYSLATVAQNLELERGRPEMLRHLIAAVRDPMASPREVNRRIARLPFLVFVTTRYDTFL